MAEDSAQTTSLMAAIKSFRQFLFNRLYNDYHQASEKRGLDGYITQEDIDFWVRAGKALIAETDRDALVLVKVATANMGLDPGYLEDQLEFLARMDGSRWNEVKRIVEGGQFSELAEKILRDRNHLARIIPKTGIRKRLHFFRMDRAMTVTQRKYFAYLQSSIGYVLTERGRMLNRQREEFDPANPFMGPEERIEIAKRFKRLKSEGYFT